jgi:hypothetical protein
MCGEVGHKDPQCGHNVSLILRENHEEDKLFHLRDDLPALLGRDKGNRNRWDCIWFLYNFLFKVIITL